MKHKRYERFLVGMSCIWLDAGMREYSSASVLSAAIITAFQWACMKAHSNTISAVLRVIISVPVVHSTHFKKP